MEDFTPFYLPDAGRKGRRIPPRTARVNRNGHYHTLTFSDDLAIEFATKGVTRLMAGQSSAGDLMFMVSNNEGGIALTRDKGKEHLNRLNCSALVNKLVEVLGVPKRVKRFDLMLCENISTDPHSLAYKIMLDPTVPAKVKVITASTTVKMGKVTSAALREMESGQAVTFQTERLRDALTGRTAVCREHQKHGCKFSTSLDSDNCSLTVYKH